MSAVPPRHHVNPYIAGSAVSGAEMFFGREDVFAFIRRNLIGRHSNHPIALYGQRRAGKTSVLRQLHRHLDAEYWCVFIDLHGLNLNGLGNLMQGIATVISRELRRDHQVTVEVPERSAFLADPTSAFERVFLDQVWAALGDNQLVLMLDEAVRLDEEMQAGRLDRGVFDYLRHLMQHHERLNFVFSLGSSIEEMSRDYAFLFSVSLYHEISFLEPAAARDLITCPARGHYGLTDQAIDRILQITSGHPYYTQLLCHCVFDAWARNPTATIDASDVDDVLAEAIELGSANLTYVWLDSSPAEQVLMAGLATALPGTSTMVTADQVREAWHNAGVDVPGHEITRALRGLTGREVITGSNAYSFTVDLQRLWLNKHRRLDWVKEDLAAAIAQWKPSAQLRADRTEQSPVETEDLEDTEPPAQSLTDSLESAPLVRFGNPEGPVTRFEIAQTSDSSRWQPMHRTSTRSRLPIAARLPQSRVRLAAGAVAVAAVIALITVVLSSQFPDRPTSPPVATSPSTTSPIIATKPFLKVNKAAVQNGGQVVINGGGFKPGEIVYVDFWWGGVSNIYQMAKLVANATGNFGPIHATIRQDVAGPSNDYSIDAKGATSGLTASAPISIEAS